MKSVPLIGRILFSAIFISSGVNHFVQFTGMTWYARIMNVPLPEVAVLGTGLMILVGGLMVLAGFQARIGAALLAVFLIATAVMMHGFWAIEEPMRRGAEMSSFMKNIALVGASLFIIYFGSGPFSLEREKKRKKR